MIDLGWEPMNTDLLHPAGIKRFLIHQMKSFAVRVKARDVCCPWPTIAKLYEYLQFSRQYGESINDFYKILF